MLITKTEIERLASLSQLEFDDLEKESMVLDMEKITEFVSQINRFQLNTEVFQRSVTISQLREDEIIPSMSVEKILKNAPDKEENSFFVPKVVD